MTAHDAPSVTVRLAGPEDLRDVAALLSERDDQTRDAQTVGTYLWGLDPGCTRTWVAYIGDVPAGLTMLYLRDMHWPPGEGGDVPIVRAGYWSHLYVRPEHRSKMIYPQLVLAMLRDMNAAGLAAIFTATRQPHVAEGHQKLGFSLVGAWSLKYRPLRPFRLLAKQKASRVVGAVAAPLDALCGFVTGTSRGPMAGVEGVPLESAAVEEVVKMMNDPRRGAVRQRWTVEQFRRRFAATLDAAPYRITAVRRGGRVAAALVMAIAERGARIRAGVVLDVAVAEEARDADVRTLIGDAHRHAYSQGCEIMLSLAPSLAGPQSGRPVAAYITSGAERYHLLVYPKKMAQPPNAAAALERWAFTFADHDAF